jgi:hypothetical protein
LTRHDVSCLRRARYGATSGSSDIVRWSALEPRAIAENSLVERLDRLAMLAIIMNGLSVRLEIGKAESGKRPPHHPRSCTVARKSQASALEIGLDRPRPKLS